MSEIDHDGATAPKRPMRFVLMRTLLGTLIRRGPTEFFRLTYVMLRYRFRVAYDENTGPIVIGFHVLLGLAGACLVIAAFGMSGTVTAGSIAVRLAGAVAGVALVFVAGTWFTMPAFHRSVLLGEVVASVCYGMACVALCWFGWRYALGLASSNPAEFGAFVLLVVAAVVVFGHPLSLLARFLVLRARLNHYAFETPYQQLLAIRPRRGGYRQVAIHEAGHALMYALGNRIPEDASAYIDTDTLSPAMGQVSFPGGRNGDISFELLEWKLVACLAGMVAETVDAGSHGFGAGGDMRAWQELAVPYLLLHPDVTFFEEPKSELEMESNKRELVALKKRMLTVVTRYVRANWPVVIRVAASLEEVEYLDYKQLADLLVGVKRTGGLPTAQWPAELGGIDLDLAVGHEKKGIHA
ncbi:metalloprotease [Ralstonia pseudosolanacearum]|uniref:metalloprotease n=1 Tax=Ralstonia pseudosolanacearum TaxID=1310165 RepID=UPI001C8CEB18|nr:metalloprotease [Ralstonia pseudosolanacearum]MBX9430576.1 metalloprotease [Ralstonia pseudosolanacearum]